METAQKTMMRVMPSAQGSHRQPLKRVTPSAEEATTAPAVMNTATRARFLRAS
jgi:hypothetical protein